MTREQTQRLIDVCSNAEMRLVVALSRYGGLRCPSEHLELRWNDIDWSEGMTTVRSPKTRKLGKPSRRVPIFDELKPYLEDCWDPEAEFVLTKYPPEPSTVPADATQCEGLRGSGQNRSAGVDGNRTEICNCCEDKQLLIQPNEAGAESGADFDESHFLEDDLAELMDLWPLLDLEARQAILEFGEQSVSETVPA